MNKDENMANSHPGLIVHGLVFYKIVSQAIPQSGSSAIFFRNRDLPWAPSSAIHLPRLPNCLSHMPPELEVVDPRSKSLPVVGVVAGKTISEVGR